MSTIKLQLKRGAPVMQDFRFFRWPGPYEAHADQWFDADINGANVTLCAFGFGVLGGPDGAYGNGAVHVKVAHLQDVSPATEGITGGK